KQIKWSSAKGYEDFKWEDQNVIAVGYEYATDKWSARLGYNYANNPITSQGTTPGSLGTKLNTFNLVGFPAIVESHITIGGSYVFSEKTSLDLAYTYAPEVEQTLKNALGTDVSTKHSQTALSLGLNYTF
ncbi:MAG: aromatic hydrocarbon degradation protein, partial [Sulfurimonas sp.]|nr:aromatic hydrocarbon degradation protein [Sulfurimonas sp.]